MRGLESGLEGGSGIESGIEGESGLEGEALALVAVAKLTRMSENQLQGEDGVRGECVSEWANE